MYRTVSSLLVLVLVVIGIALVLSSEEAEAAQIEDPVGQNKTFSLPGGRVIHNFWIMPGENITLTIWNYSGPEGRSTVMSFGIGNYYEKSDTFTSGTTAEFNIVTGRTYVFWAIATVPGTMSLSLDMYDDGTSVSCEYRIDRASSEYSPDSFIREVIEDATAGIVDNITNLTNITQNLSDQTASLLENTTNIWQSIHNMTGDIEEMSQMDTHLLGELDDVDRRLGDLSTLLWALSDLQNGTASDVDSLASLLEQLNATLTNVTADVEDLKASGVDLTWVEANLTEIRSTLAGVVRDLGDVSEFELDLLELENTISNVASDIEALDEDLTAVEEGMPAPYDDTALLERIAQLEGQNQLLQQQLADQEDEQDEIREATPSSAVGYVALVLAVVGIVIALAVFMRKGRAELWEES